MRLSRLHSLRRSRIIGIDTNRRLREVRGSAKVLRHLPIHLQMRLHRQLSKLPNLGLLTLLVEVKSKHPPHNHLPTVQVLERVLLRAQHPPLRRRIKLSRSLRPKQRANASISKITNFTSDPRMPKRTVQLWIINNRLHQHTPRAITKPLSRPHPTNRVKPDHIMTQVKDTLRSVALLRRLNDSKPRGQFTPTPIPQRRGILRRPRLNHYRRLTLRGITSSGSNERNRVFIRRPERLRQFKFERIALKHLIRLKRVERPIQ